MQPQLRVLPRTKHSLLTTCSAVPQSHFTAHLVIVLPEGDFSNE